MDILLFLHIFVAAVNAGKVNYNEPHEEIENDHHNEFENDPHEKIAKRNAPEHHGSQHGQWLPIEDHESVLIHNAPQHGSQHGSFPPFDREPILIINAPEHGSWGMGSQPDVGTVDDCVYTVAPLVSTITVTSTNLWLETVTYSSFLLSSTMDTVFVTNTVAKISRSIVIEPPVTVTCPPPVENVWATVTNTQTKIWEKLYTNMIPSTTTFTRHTQETECPVVCSTRTVVGQPFYETDTTTWTHTQTMHEKVMVTTVWPVTVTITDHQGNVEADNFTESYTVTRTVVETEFDMITQITASTLWVNHIEREVCN